MGVLITASAQDANHQIYPLAYAVVDSENDRSWRWFFEQLLVVIPCSSDLVFVSDRHLSIGKSVESVFSCAKHVICTRHLKGNLKNRFKQKGIVRLFSQAADSYTISDFNKYFQDICTANAQIGEYLREVSLEKWSRACFSGDRYNIMTTNNSESVNGVLKEARQFPITALLEFIRCLLSRWFAERKAVIEEHLNQIPPNINSILEERCKKSKAYGVRMLNKTEFEVFSGGFCAVVDLAQRKCTCRMFDLDKMPCVHAMAAIQQMKYPVRSFISDYYQFQAWCLAYEETIYPLPNKSEWNVPDHINMIVCNPPNVRRKVGRPKRNRIPSIGEFRGKKKKKIKASEGASSSTAIVMK